MCGEPDRVTDFLGGHGDRQVVECAQEPVDHHAPAESSGLSSSFSSPSKLASGNWAPEVAK